MVEQLDPYPSKRQPTSTGVLNAIAKGECAVWLGIAR